MTELATSLQLAQDIQTGKYSWQDLAEMNFDTLIAWRTDRPGEEDAAKSFEQLSILLANQPFVVGFRLLGSAASDMAGTFPFRAQVTTDADRLLFNASPRRPRPDLDVEVLTTDHTERDLARIVSTAKLMQSRGHLSPEVDISIGLIDYKCLLDIFTADEEITEIINSGPSSRLANTLIEPYLRFLALHNYRANGSQSVYDFLFQSALEQLNRLPALDHFLRYALSEYLTFNSYRNAIKMGTCPEFVIPRSELPLMWLARRDNRGNPYGIYQSLKLASI